VGHLRVFRWLVGIGLLSFLPDTPHRLSSSAAKLHAHRRGGGRRPCVQRPQAAPPPCAPRTAAGRAGCKAARVRVGPTGAAGAQVKRDLACRAGQRPT